MTDHAPHNHPTFVAGRARLARLVKLLLAQNDLSHHDLESFARWAAIDQEAGEWLSKSQISTLRNAKLPKPGPQLFLALAWVNERLAELTLQPSKRLARPLYRLSCVTWRSSPAPGSCLTQPRARLVALVICS